MKCHITWAMWLSQAPWLFPLFFPSSINMLMYRQDWLVSQEAYVLVILRFNNIIAQKTISLLSRIVLCSSWFAQVPQVSSSILLKIPQTTGCPWHMLPSQRQSQPVREHPRADRAGGLRAQSQTHFIWPHTTFKKIWTSFQYFKIKMSIYIWISSGLSSKREEPAEPSLHSSSKAMTKKGWFLLGACMHSTAHSGPQVPTSHMWSTPLIYITSWALAVIWVFNPHLGPGTVPSIL